MTQAVRRWTPLLGLLALVASVTPASAQISANVLNLPRQIAGTNSVAFDSKNQVYLVIEAGPPVMGQFLNKDGAPIGSHFNISLETPVDSSTPYTGWSNVAFGGPADDPVFLVTYISLETTANAKFGRLVRYRPGTAPDVSDRSKITEVWGEWYAAEKAQSAWDGERFVVGTRVMPPGGLFPLPQLHHFDVNGNVTGGQYLGDSLDYEGSPSLACTAGGICLATGYAGGIPFGSKGGSWARLFNGRTFDSLSTLFYLDDHTSINQDQSVVFNTRTGQFLTAWWQAGYIGTRVVYRDGRLASINPRAFGPGAGDNRMAYNSSTGTTLLVSKYSPPPAYEGVDLYVAELGDDGTAVNLNNVIRVTPWDNLVLSYIPSVAVDSVSGRWLCVFVLDAGGRAALVQGTAAPQLLPPTDFNGDGKADLLWRDSASGANTVWYMDGATRTGWAPLDTVADSNWQIAAVGDLNGDGKPDLVWRNRVTGTTTVWYMNGTTFVDWAYLDTVTDPTWQIAVAVDLNGDRKADLVWRNYVTGINTVWYMNGATCIGWALLDAAPDTRSQIAGAGDFNADRKPDLVWWNAGTGAATVWYMNGAIVTGSASLGTVADTNWQIALVGDVNGDGSVDLVWRNYVTGANTIWYMDQVTRTGSAPLDSVPATWAIVHKLNTAAPSDFNRDGKMDLVWRDSVTGTNTVWYMDGATRIGWAYLPTVADPDWQIAAIADLNGDGKPDLVWRHSVTGTNTVWYMDGVTLTGWAYLDTVADTNWQIVAAADFNGDGKPDLEWWHSVTGMVAVWYMDGATCTGWAYLPAVIDPNWEIAAAVDFNADGKPDLVWRNSTTGAAMVWYMDGATHTGSVPLDAIADTSWQIAVCGDFNADNRPDIVWRNYVTGANTVWYMSGTTQIGLAAMETVPDTHWAIVHRH
jgi:hypothetical protein